ncbi:TetR/AcrR family transcriptional regulator [Qipengyuania sp. JC766]|uniref:TetR/AcrR family transcriptional regulator n=1 Tax=Qipengyuania sp. JC766 TaxID=3232139 RepID=UPI00345A26E0
MSISENRRGGRTIDAEKRSAILAAATQSFFLHGFAGSSIEAIAAEAGVSKVTIYNQFGDKDGLFTAAVERECDRMRGAFDIDGETGGTLRERLTAIGEAMAAFLSRPKMIQFERRIAAETERDPAIGATFLAAGPHKMKAAFAAFLKAKNEAGEVRIEDADLAAEQFVAMCKGMGDLERRFGAPIDPERDRDRITGAVEVFCRSYAVDGCDR